MTGLRLTGPIGTEFTVPKRNRLTAGQIKATVARHYGLKVSDLEGPRRKRKVTRPRQLAMVLTRELTNLSYPNIGAHYGGRDHTTALHAIRRIAELRETNPKVDEHYWTLKLILTSPPPANDLEAAE